MTQVDPKVQVIEQYLATRRRIKEIELKGSRVMATNRHRVRSNYAMDNDTKLPPN